LAENEQFRFTRERGCKGELHSRLRRVERLSACWAEGPPIRIIGGESRCMIGDDAIPALAWRLATHDPAGPTRARRCAESRVAPTCDAEADSTRGPPEAWPKGGGETSCDPLALQPPAHHPLGPKDLLPRATSLREFYTPAPPSHLLPRDLAITSPFPGPRKMIAPLSLALGPGPGPGGKDRDGGAGAGGRMIGRGWRGIDPSLWPSAACSGSPGSAGMMPG
jgi:hypothetical protein